MSEVEELWQSMNVERSLAAMVTRLSSREDQVLRLLAADIRVGEIATQLGLSLKTVSTYKTRVKEKLDIETDAQWASLLLLVQMKPRLTGRRGRLMTDIEELGQSMSGHTENVTIVAAEAPRKVSYIGAPACFALEMACQMLNRAFGGFGCYQVGSSLLRADWRDVDVRLIMPDVEFLALFPDVDLESYNWEFDPRWLIMTTSISDHLRKVTGLPVDFQFQPHGPAQRHAEKKRSPLGLRFARPSRALGMAVDP